MRLIARGASPGRLSSENEPNIARSSAGNGFFGAADANKQKDDCKWSSAWFVSGSL